ncbi:MAG: enoyl-CoA hydratase-related protein [Dehalococcoidia bacterium]|nr:enoyl-CoA hydratase-related protein [Dehalococcoidia bacterium]
MPTVLFEAKDGIAYITLNRPQAMNSLNMEMRPALSEALLRFSNDDTLRVAILTGAGDRAFCAGRDLKESAQAFSEGKAPYAQRPPFPSLLHNTLEVWKPMIAAINGYAIGGGLEIALACDIRIAAENAQMGLSEAKRGLYPGGGGVVRLTRLVPMGMALEMLFTGDLVDAREAHRIGLVNQVVPRADLMPAAERMAYRIMDCAPLSLRKIKELAYKGLDVPLPVAYRLDIGPDLAGSEDAKEGAMAFVEKRKPKWKGK